MKKNLYKMLLTLALPITVQNLILSSVNMADVFMIGKLGAGSVASLGLANQLVFLLTTFLAGIGSGGAIFIAQYYGKGELSKVKNVLTLGFWLTLAVSIAFFILANKPRGVLSLYTKDKEVIAVTASYLKIVSWSFVATGISYLFSNLLRGLGESRVPMITTSISLVINIVFNYLLIFGKFGFPIMGVEGAAIATTIARVVEAVILVAVIYIKKWALALGVEGYFSFDKTFARSFASVAGAVMINEVLWALGQTTYSSIYGNMGTVSLAAINIENSIERIAFTGVIGFACAAAVIVGQEIGRGRRERAYDYAKKLYGLSVNLALVVSIVVACFAKSIVGLFGVEAEVSLLAYKTLIVFALVFPLKSLSLTKMVGVLRGGGDTKYAMKSNLGALWLVGIPLAAFGAFYLRLPIYIVYLMATAEEIIRLSFGAKRFVSKKWIHDLVNN